MLEMLRRIEAQLDKVSFLRAGENATAEETATGTHIDDCMNKFLGGNGLVNRRIIQGGGLSYNYSEYKLSFSYDTLPNGSVTPYKCTILNGYEEFVVDFSRATMEELANDIKEFIVARGFPPD
jgi:hypothetical protein